MLRYILVFISFILISACSAEKSFEQTMEAGRICLEDGRYNEAIVFYSMAEAQAERSSDSYALGQVYHAMAKTYRATYGYFEEIAYLAKASDAFALAGKPYSSRSMMFDSGLASYNCKDFVSAERIYRDVLSQAHEAADTLLEARCLEAYAALCLDVEGTDPQLPITMLKRVANDLRCPLTSDDRGVLAYAYALAGNSREADDWLKKALRTAQTPQERANARLREYQVMSKLGRSEEALHALEAFVAYGNSIDQQNLRRSVIAAREDYLSQEAEMSQAKLKMSRLTAAVVALMFLAIVFALISYFRMKRLNDANRLAEEQAELEKYMGIAEDLQTRLNHASDEKETAAKGTDIKLQAPRYYALERLCEQYYIYEGTENLQDKIMKEVKTIIKDLREDPESVKLMEDVLNNSCNNIVKRLRTQIPTLKEDEIRLYVFAASGFSSTTISTILEKEKNIIYNRIYRLKGKISSSDAENKQDFLAFLNR